MAPEIPVRFLSTPQEYGEILSYQESLRDSVIAKKSEGEVLFLEHLPVYTSGLRGKTEQFIRPVGDIPVFNVRRGGELTFHNLGQLVIYPVIDFRHFGFRSIKEFVLFFADSIVKVLRDFCGVAGAVWRDDPSGIWVGERKIGFTGLHFRKFVPVHGFSVNISNDLAPFENIIPCGIVGCKITSVEKETGNIFDVNEVARKISEIINLNRRNDVSDP